jgi:hypothetical protein
MSDDVKTEGAAESITIRVRDQVRLDIVHTLFCCFYVNSSYSGLASSIVSLITCYDDSFSQNNGLFSPDDFFLPRPCQYFQFLMRFLFL